MILARRLVAYPLGDANMDGKINASDVSKVNAFINKTGTLTNDGKLRADVNYDGVINSTDVNLIKKMYWLADFESDIWIRL